jgi:hypothetical protein
MDQQPPSFESIPAEMRVCIETKRAALEEKARQGGVVSRTDVDRAMQECVPRQPLQDVNHGAPASFPRNDPREGFHLPEPAPHIIPGRPIMRSSEGAAYPAVGSGTIPFDNRRQIMIEGGAGTVIEHATDFQTMLPRESWIPEGGATQASYPANGFSQPMSPTQLQLEQGFHGGADLQGSFSAPPFIE